MSLLGKLALSAANGPRAGGALRFINFLRVEETVTAAVVRLILMATPLNRSDMAANSGPGTAGTNIASYTR